MVERIRGQVIKRASINVACAKLPQSFPARAKFLETKKKLQDFIETSGGTLSYEKDTRLVNLNIVHQPGKNQLLFKLFVQCPVRDKDTHFENVSLAVIRLLEFTGLNEILHGGVTGKFRNDGKLYERTVPFVLHMQYPDGNEPVKRIQ
jgi:hypothetical protein